MMPSSGSWRTLRTRVRSTTSDRRRSSTRRDRRQCRRIGPAEARCRGVGRRRGGRESWRTSAVPSMIVAAARMAPPPRSGHAGGPMRSARLG